ncbi:MAG: aminotransferase class V-fold PLP-dependent enzyme [Microbacterium sp.]|uniref:aminotransferase class V-fold PLP-dependent enzyme n=1 Tax=Microbacterium sp. TaxID=51671 RepID=UPI001AD0814E|nr:aminotransferase class V-fold PLP-dependent enzyme [Microbacterium sp.]MBN9152972.1 aminotransferase class V-fold PLP-dependent enzyme [Microbacterium sp.]MBN9172901.1 aminotransferase class V-fold PLP-dependent enzyme [Microbacterium sp.]
MTHRTLDPAPTAAAETEVARLHEQFIGARGYLAACTSGLPTRDSRAAVLADLDRRPDPAFYTGVVDRTRAAFARLVGTSEARIAIGSQASTQIALVATALPDDAEVLCADGDFSSVVMPFVHAGRGIRVRTVPLDALADEIGPTTALVAFSLVQSATGAVADAAAIVAAAARHGTWTLCDATQAAGWMPVSAEAFDALVCHAYKWLCAPRGVSFLALSERLAARMRPVQAGWYAGADPWASCYGGASPLAEDARRFDVSPAWQAFVGAEPAIGLFARVDAAAVHAYTTRLATTFRERRGLPGSAGASAIVTWTDPDGCDLARLSAAGIVASGRAGRARVAFHVFNDDEDVELAVRALTP